MLAGVPAAFAIELVPPVLVRPVRTIGLGIEGLGEQVQRTTGEG
ncbi:MULTISPECIES: hypothetical protein [Tabrizicola]|nr:MULTISPECIES: hypothetical protein [Tabrizicola]